MRKSTTAHEEPNKQFVLEAFKTRAILEEAKKRLSPSCQRFPEAIQPAIDLIDNCIERIFLCGKDDRENINDYIREVEKQLPTSGNLLENAETALTSLRRMEEQLDFCDEGVSQEDSQTLKRQIDPLQSQIDAAISVFERAKLLCSHNNRFG